ncbi:MAG: hypothetical protein ABIN97_11670 [Ginsengibacter sp.]
MKKLSFIILISFTCNAMLFAQQQTSEDPFKKSLFPPELIMQNQQTISLTESQRNSITKEMQDAQSEFMTLQWNLEKEAEKFKALIEKIKPDEKDVTDQLEKMLGVENKIKKRQISLLIRIKGALTPEQQEKLKNLK